MVIRLFITSLWNDLIVFVLLDADPLKKYYTMATSGNSDEIKIWTIIARSVPKYENAQSSLSIILKDTYDGHCSAVTCIRFSHTGNLLLSSSLDKLVKIWNETGFCVATLESHTRYVNCVAISKDSLLAASGIIIILVSQLLLLSKKKVRQVQMINRFQYGIYLAR